MRVRKSIENTTMKSITNLFSIQYPIISGGMIWCSGWRLAAAVSNAGGLGLIGAGSMTPEILRQHIQKCRTATSKPFGVNLPLLMPNVAEIIAVLIEEKVSIVFTSAGSAATWTPILKKEGIKVAHVVSSVALAKKVEMVGADAIVAEGVEAGGHNGKNETSTMVLIPEVAAATTLPVIAAGGIGSGKQMYAAIALGAAGVQIGSLFAASEESSAHPIFKQALVDAQEGDTRLFFRKLSPTRLLRGNFYARIERAEAGGATEEELLAIIGKGRTKKGMFEGDLNEGELEIGQIVSSIRKILPVSEIVASLTDDFRQTKIRMEKQYL